MDETKQSNDVGRTFLGEMGTVGCKDEKAYGCRGDGRDGPGGEASKPGSRSPGATRPTVTRLSGSAGGLPSWLAQGQPLPTIGTDRIRRLPRAQWVPLSSYMQCLRNMNPLTTYSPFLCIRFM